MDALMAKICGSTKELEEKLSLSLNEFRREMSAAQERMAKQFSKRSACPLTVRSRGRVMNTSSILTVE